MKVLGLELRKPSFSEFTAASVMGVGLWLAGVGAMVQSGHAATRADLGALLVMAWWACVAVRCGLDLRGGWRPAVLNFGVALALLGVNQVLWA